MDFHRFSRFPSMGSCAGKIQPAALIESFARFQAGFLSSEDFHRFPLIFIGFHRFPFILLDFYGFHGFPSMNAYNGKIRPAAPIETFARFQAGFLSSEDFHRFPLIIIDSHGFSLIFIDFH